MVQRERRKVYFWAKRRERYMAVARCWKRKARAQLTTMYPQFVACSPSFLQIWAGFVDLHRFFPFYFLSLCFAIPPAFRLHSYAMPSSTFFHLLSFLFSFAFNRHQFFPLFYRIRITYQILCKNLLSFHFGHCNIRRIWTPDVRREWKGAATAIKIARARRVRLGFSFIEGASFCSLHFIKLGNIFNFPWIYIIL